MLRMERKMLAAIGLACALMIAPLSAQSPEPAALTSSGYVIDAELDTAAHHLTAKVVVSFTVPETAEPNSAKLSASAFILR